MKEQIPKLLDVGFIKSIQHLTWMDNVVLMKRIVVKFDVASISELTWHIKR